MEPDFQTESFLEDFAEEADQILKQVTLHFLDMAQGGAPAPPVFQDLLRSFHTLKGLCGMVGLTTGAQLAHLLETLLNRVRSGQLGLSPELLDQLLKSTQMMNRLIAASAGGGPPAGLAEHLEELDRLVNGHSNSPLPDEILRHLSEDEKKRVSQSRRLALAIFLPSSEQAAQGQTVSQAREEVQKHGHLIKAVPLIEGKTVRFAFIIDLAPSAQPEPGPGLSWDFLSRESQEAPAEAPLEAIQETYLPRHSATVRVEVSRLDDIMRLVGDLVVSRWRLQTVLDSSTEHLALQDGVSRVERQLRDLRQAVMRARMVRLAEVFGRMPLTVRELARATGREVRLHVSGEETQLDKVLVERLLDPLLHLVRNAIAHGLEDSPSRLRAGKDEVGNLWLKGHPEGDSIVIEVEDDGRGLDLESIARQSQLPPGEILTPARALDLICRQGFSTRSQLGLDAGRGVGMDVVRRAVEDVGGTLGLESTPGRGCRFWMRIPMTLTIMDSFLIQLGDETYAVARDSISEIVEVTPESVASFPQGDLLPWRGNSLPLRRMRQLVGTPGEGPRSAHALVHGQQAFVVDRVVALREVVVRAVFDPLVAHPWLCGATELGDGTLALIVDLSRLGAMQ